MSPSRRPPLGRRPLPPRRTMLPRIQLRGECSWSAACSIHKASPCRPQPWRPPLARPSGRTLELEAQRPAVLGQATADGSGRFRLETPRTSSSQNDEFVAIAHAPGYGIGWAALDPDRAQPAAEISLRPEQAITGRVLDQQGRPASGVLVSVSSILTDRVTSGPSQERYDGPYFGQTRVNDLPAWPRPATTDANGRFELRGVGRRLQAQLNIIDPRFALQTIEVKTDDAPVAKAVEIVVQPAKRFNGRVTYADTGQPVPRAIVNIAAGGAGQRGFRATRVQTDDDGRFQANPWAGDRFFVSAIPPQGTPYLVASKRVEWPKGAVEQSVGLALPRGVRIRGKVTEEPSKLPVAGASVSFVPRSRGDADANPVSTDAKTAADGSFELIVGAHPGHLAVKAASDEYVVREIGHREFFQGEPGGVRILSHSFHRARAEARRRRPGGARRASPWTDRLRRDRRPERRGSNRHLDHRPCRDGAHRRRLGQLAG